jgi:hypothetical protein
MKNMACPSHHSFTDEELEALMALRERTATREAGRRWMTQQPTHIQNTLDLIAAGHSFPGLPKAQELNEQLGMLLTESTFLRSNRKKTRHNSARGLTNLGKTARG